MWHLKRWLFGSICILAGTTVWPGSHIRLQATLPNEQACGFVANEAYALERDAIIEQVRRTTLRAPQLLLRYSLVETIAQAHCRSHCNPPPALQRYRDLKANQHSTWRLIYWCRMTGAFAVRSLRGHRFDQLRS